VSARDLLIFDMDGVLVDVTESYREAIRATVYHFTGQPVALETIQEFKMQVGWNDDWALSYRLIQDAGVDVPFHSVVACFQDLFRGEGGYSGLIQREKWIAEDDLLERLADRYRLAIFTGRFHEEAAVTLNRFAPDRFDPVVGTDDLKNGKPHPEGLRKICSEVPHDRVFYMGDTADDAKSAEMANVPFIGIVGSGTPNYAESVAELKRRRAIAVLNSINGLKEALKTL
jgi:HAD superfamily hydrolase (TIGR01548 family)